MEMRDTFLMLQIRKKNRITYVFICLYIAYKYTYISADASYILDVAELPKDMKGSYSGTGGKGAGNMFLYDAYCIYINVFYMIWF